MATTFKAAVLFATTQPLEIVEIEIPVLSHGQVLVQNRYSGICRSQLMEISGGRGVDKWLPHLLGHEGFGIVREIGSGVKKVSPGDKVIVSWITGSGEASSNPIFISKNGEKINSGAATTFSEYSVVSENRIFKAPEGFAEDFLPQFGCALLTGGGMVISTLNNVDVQPEQSGLIIGFGGVGTAAALALKTYSNFSVTVVEKSESRRAIAQELGFTKIFGTMDELQTSIGNERFDYCFESAGTVESIESGFAKIKDSGALVFASHPKNGEVIRIDPYELIKGKTIRGTWGGNLAPEIAISTIAERLLASKTAINPLVGPRFALDDVNEGLLYLESGKPGKPVIDFGDIT